MIRRLLAAAALLLAGCGGTEGADGYVFAGKQVDRSTVQISKKEYRSFAALKTAMPKEAARAWTDRHLEGGAWGELYPDGSCTIHFIDPEISYQPEWIGHETGHCFYGEWHP